MTVSAPYRRYSDSTGLPAVPGLVTVDTRNRAFALVWPDVWVYDSTGRFAGPIGPRGRGPGEFERNGPIAIGPGDTVFASDPATARLSVLTPDLRFVRSSPLPPGTFALQWIPEAAALLAASPRYDGVTTGAQYTLFDGKGTRRSLIVSRPSGGSNDGRETQRRLGLLNDSTFVAMTVAAPLRVEVWSVPAGTGTWYQIDDPVFHQAVRRSPDGLVMEPGVIAVRAVDGRFLWILILDGDARWRDGIEVTPVGKEFRIDHIDPDRYWDSIVLVVDLMKRHIVARLRSPLGCVGFAEPSSLVCGAVNPDDTIRLEVRHIRLDPGPAR